VKPQVIPFKTFADDRGIVYGALTELQSRGIKRTYVVKNWSKGMIRAWHGHRQAETYMHVFKGAAKLAAINMDDQNDPNNLVVTLTEYMPSVLHVPAGYFNGAMSLEDDTRILVYSTLLLDDVKNDDHRMPYLSMGGDRIWKVDPR
jgi:dTDP-4-dehydrorhamnose 3,5-epimerase-like enzyme